MALRPASPQRGDAEQHRGPVVLSPGCLAGLPGRRAHRAGSAHHADEHRERDPQLHRVPPGKPHRGALGTVARHQDGAPQRGCGHGAGQHGHLHPPPSRGRQREAQQRRRVAEGGRHHPPHQHPVAGRVGGSEEHRQQGAPRHERHRHPGEAERQRHPVELRHQPAERGAAAGLVLAGQPGRRRLAQRRDEGHAHHLQRHRHREHPQRGAPRGRLHEVAGDAGAEGDEQRAHPQRQRDGRELQQHVPAQVGTMGLAGSGVVQQAQRGGGVVRGEHHGRRGRERGGAPGQRARGRHHAAERRHVEQAAQHHGPAHVVHPPVPLEHAVEDVAQHLDGAHGRDRHHYDRGGARVPGPPAERGDGAHHHDRRHQPQAQVVGEGVGAAHVRHVHDAQVQGGEGGQRRGDRQRQREGAHRLGRRQARQHQQQAPLPRREGEVAREGPPRVASQRVAARGCAHLRRRAAHGRGGREPQRQAIHRVRSVNRCAATHRECSPGAAWSDAPHASRVRAGGIDRPRKRGGKEPPRYLTALGGVADECGNRDDFPTIPRISPSSPLVLRGSTHVYGVIRPPSAPETSRVRGRTREPAGAGVRIRRPRQVCQVVSREAFSLAARAHSMPSFVSSPTRLVDDGKAWVSHGVNGVSGVDDVLRRLC